MALERKDRVQDSTSTTGTGTIDLDASGFTGFRTFASAVSSGATVRYLIISDDKSEWEVGEGVFTSGSPDTLTRDTVIASSNSGNLVDFSAGTKKVSLAFTSEDAPFKATGAEINTGTDDAKFTTPKAIADSILKQYPEGAMLNGKIVPSVTSDNLTVALKTKAGNDPSSTDPVYVMIAGELRSITSALSVTLNAGTNWFNAGSDELKTQEIDYFVYLGYNATDGVTIGFARIPYATQYGDFSTTTTDEKYCGISTTTNAASGDYYNVIGRFAATLSAGSDYNWSVPTFTAENLIQRPIYETRLTTAISPVIANISGTTSGQYQLVGRTIVYSGKINITAAGDGGIITFSAPFKATGSLTFWGQGHYLDANVAHYIPAVGMNGGNLVRWQENNTDNWMKGNRSGIDNGDALDFTITYQI